MLGRRDMFGVALHLVSFGDPFSWTAKRRLEKQARSLNLFTSIRVLSPKNLSPEFRLKHKKRLTPAERGFGYWIWKPRVILDTLLSVDVDDIVLYVDIGCHLNPLGMARMNRYVAQVRESQSGILSSEYCEEEKKWTKGDVLRFFGVEHNAVVLDSTQRQTGAIFLRNGYRTQAFVREWLSIMEDNPNLFDDSPSLAPNFPEFIEHRHDQSIFSILSKIHGGDTFSGFELEPWALGAYETDSLSYPILAKRDFRTASWRIGTFARKILIPGFFLSKTRGKVCRPKKGFFKSDYGPSALDPNSKSSQMEPRRT